MYYSVVFNFVGLWNKKDENTAKYLLYHVRNEMVDVVNPLLEKFNSEWDKLHPEIDGMEEGSDIWKEYNSWMAANYNIVTADIQMRTEKKTGLKIYCDPETDAQIVVQNSNGGKAYITIKPMI